MLQLHRKQALHQLLQYTACLTPRRRFSVSRWSSSMSSEKVRECFLDYFNESPAGRHIIVPSVSVVPHNDPSLTFVNAGMNQFKSIILGEMAPKASRMANVQKCIRVGGKHNDLAQVGLDGHHHTFFEMMGNWSFGDYFKKTACEMAWEVLTKQFKLPPEKLFVTYFEGNEELELKADLETRECWRSIGVPDSRILPFGMKDNFWEMGLTGPCGPCTEIHYDHFGRGAAGVNQGFDDLVEIWNVVFMEYNRFDEGVLETLKKKHVDTGMGLERLCAILNGSTSNYNSDLFEPIFTAISKATGAPSYERMSFSGPDDLNTKYRILADHARMITVCLTDDMFPDQCNRLRTVVRRALKICKADFRSDYKLLIELAHRVSETLGAQYPQIPKNMFKVPIILQAEEEHFQRTEESGLKAKCILKSMFPSRDIPIEPLSATQVLEGVKFLEKFIDENTTTLDGNMSHKLVHTFGVNEEQLSIIASLKGLHFDVKDFKHVSNEVRRNIKLKGMIRVVNDVRSFPKTDTSFLHTYLREKEFYQFPLINAVVLGIDKDEKSVNYLEEGEHGVVYLDRTNLYAESGGQVGDSGNLINRIGNIKFKVTDCQRVMGSPNHIAHVGYVVRGRLKVRTKVTVRLSEKVRLRTMQNHTAIHLLNEALNQELILTCQKSSHVDSTSFKFDFVSFQQKIDSNFIRRIEERVLERIAQNTPIKREIIPFNELINNKRAILIPGENYPDHVSTITLQDGTIEPCCGTHVLQTGDVQSFAIVKVKSMGNGVVSVRGFTGKNAQKARQKGLNVLANLTKIHEKLAVVDQNKEISREIKDLQNLKQNINQNTEVIPWTVQMEAETVMDEMIKHLQSLERISSKSLMQDEIEGFIENKKNEPFIVHFFDLGDSTKVNLSKVTKLVKDKPVLLIARTKEGVNARAVVPAELVTEHFTAIQWIQAVAEYLNGRASPPRSQDPSLICNMPPVKFKESADVTEAVEEALKRAKDFVEHIKHVSLKQ